MLVKLINLLQIAPHTYQQILKTDSDPSKQDTGKDGNETRMCLRSLNAFQTRTCNRNEFVTHV